MKSYSITKLKKSSISKGAKDGYHVTCGEKRNFELLYWKGQSYQRGRLSYLSVGKLKRRYNSYSIKELASKICSSDNFNSMIDQIVLQEVLTK